VARPPTAKVAGFFLFFDTGLLKNQKALAKSCLLQKCHSERSEELKGSGA
jgi:hypothetical protein